MGFVMGIWFLSTSIGDWLAGKVGSYYGTIPLKTLLGATLAVELVAAVIVFLLVKPSKRLMAGVS